MKITKTKIEISADALRFGELVRAGINAWMEAGKLLIERGAEDPTFRLQVRQSNPDLTEETIDAFERIGRNEINPRLLLADSRPGVQRLLTLPIREQNRYETEAIPLVMRADDGRGWKTEHISVRDLTRIQALQVFGAEGIRSEKQQKMWLEERRLKLNDGKLWRISGDRVVIPRKCVLTSGDLHKLLKELESE